MRTTWVVMSLKFRISDCELRIADRRSNLVSPLVSDIVAKRNSQFEFRISNCEFRFATISLTSGETKFDRRSAIRNSQSEIRNFRDMTTQVVLIRHGQSR